MIDQLGQEISVGDMVIFARGGRAIGLFLGTVDELITNLPVDRVRISGCYESKVTKAHSVIVFKKASVCLE